jgi:heme A synthase
MLTALIVALGATVLALVVVVWSGFRRRRRTHYAAVVAMLVLLAVAIRFAELYGAGLVFEGAAARVRSIHLGAVIVTFASLPFVVVSGWRLARAPAGLEPVRRTTHRKVALAFVVAVVVTFGLGLAMTLLADKA